MLLVIILACVLVLFVAFRSDQEEMEPESRLADEGSPLSDRKEEAENRIKPLIFSKTGSNKEAKKGSGRLSEEEAVKLILGRALAEHDMDHSQVDRSSGRILDENDEACLVGFDILDPETGEQLFTEVYWIHGKTLRVKDIGSLLEYRPGMIDITNGDFLESAHEGEAAVPAEGGSGEPEEALDGPADSDPEQEVSATEEQEAVAAEEQEAAAEEQEAVAAAEQETAAEEQEAASGSV